MIQNFTDTVCNVAGCFSSWWQSSTTIFFNASSLGSIRLPSFNISFISCSGDLEGRTADSALNCAAYLVDTLKSVLNITPNCCLQPGITFCGKVEPEQIDSIIEAHDGNSYEHLAQFIPLSLGIIAFTFTVYKAWRLHQIEKPNFEPPWA